MPPVFQAAKVTRFRDLWKLDRSVHYPFAHVPFILGPALFIVRVFWRIRFIPNGVPARSLYPQRKRVVSVEVRECVL